MASKGLRLVGLLNTSARGPAERGSLQLFFSSSSPANGASYFQSQPLAVPLYKYRFQA